MNYCGYFVLESNLTQHIIKMEKKPVENKQLQKLQMTLHTVYETHTTD